MKGPTYTGRSAASAHASAAARGASKKAGTRPEVLLRRALWHAGLRYRKNDTTLPGKPDIVFKRQRVAVFCDGDFWHGRHWSERKPKLRQGHNADYWIAKIERNMERDLKNKETLAKMGWTVVRVWEGDIKNRADQVVERIRTLVQTDEREQ